MSPWIWVLIIVVVIAIIAVAALMMNRRRSVQLRDQFGPEYERTMQSADGRGTAEAELEDRARRRSNLTIVPLSESARLAYVDQWRGLQEQFVDHPSEAVQSGEMLLNRVMQERGYPMSSFDEQADLISVDYPHVVENYRVAHSIHTRHLASQATTEDLREAMLRYRSLFDDLLRPGEGQTAQPSSTQAANGTPKHAAPTAPTTGREHR
jgi:hypothetical protein